MTSAQRGRGGGGGGGGGSWGSIIYLTLLVDSHRSGLCISFTDIQQVIMVLSSSGSMCAQKKLEQRPVSVPCLTTETAIAATSKMSCIGPGISMAQQQPFTVQGSGPQGQDLICGACPALLKSGKPMSPACAALSHGRFTPANVARDRQAQAESLKSVR